jgi:hypothetical protein
MDPHIQAWKAAEQKAAAAQEAAARLKEIAEAEAALPPQLRKATAKDIVVDALIWYPEHTIRVGAEEITVETHWHIVEEVLYPNDDWKAYLADDGCRYGLDNAYVEDANP